MTGGRCCGVATAALLAACALALVGDRLVEPDGEPEPGEDPSSSTSVVPGDPEEGCGYDGAYGGGGYTGGPPPCFEPGGPISPAVVADLSVVPPL